MFEEEVVQSVKIFNFIGKLYVTVITFNEQNQVPIHAEQSCGFPGRALTDAFAFEQGAFVPGSFSCSLTAKVVLCLEMQPSHSEMCNFGPMTPSLQPVLKPGALAFLWRYNTLRKSIHSYF